MPRVPVERSNTIAPARRCAFAVLRRVFERGAYADEAFQAEARELDARDRALAMRLAYGAVQRRGTLDFLIERLAERPPGRLDPPGLAALRLGLYELLYMGGSPDYAVVADAVELARARRCSAPLRTTRPSTLPSSTPTLSGSRACGGRSSGPRERGR